MARGKRQPAAQRKPASNCTHRWHGWGADPRYQTCIICGERAAHIEMSTRGARRPRGHLRMVAPIRPDQLDMWGEAAAPLAFGCDHSWVYVPSTDTRQQCERCGATRRTPLGGAQ